MVDQSQALRANRAASTLAGKDIEFDFDEQLISSPAYRRAFNSFVQHSKQSDSKIKQARNSGDATEAGDLALSKTNTGVDNAQSPRASGTSHESNLKWR